MKGYGLQLRAKPSHQQKKQSGRPPLPTPLGFRDDDDDNIESEISRQASKNKSLKDIEEQHKKALEEDPSVFDYDGVYDEMKGKVARPRAQDREERKPKYIQNLIKKAEERKQSQEIVYERKLAKERSEEDHLYADKDKFVTSAYKKKLAEQAKWMEEERLREIREEKEDVTKKTDLSDFYFNLEKNVAFGSHKALSRKPQEQAELSKPGDEGDKVPADTSARSHPLKDTNLPPDSSPLKERNADETLSVSKSISESNPVPDKQISDASVQDGTSVEQPSADQQMRDRHKRNEDAVASAKERFLARKRAKEQ
ncbi:nuclear speckle splicing regulatory protein 1-like [Tripterygium wilfordii]|uniref:Nuclear speckle splicing regulatory protein 1-like n=1 Tax=Tripterygium wilfordii TaxID=458696 RepID=A0A7J7DFS2_TRIWF|nr:nuclear speckle splicing regulatory protein 1-like [Tripterygium wilfordii]XP_038705508.1 nuclear speckle splicing regulatory protein 1-like [Tripterygium wilfordii]XP_038705509.1 nuclear speckle splicing regulatory protein 1-like [Tripterygium wilfordii]KAF5744906.1 nuclear speckle splicing regulatory protein 1-like [Tripterygium wilfordii]